MTKVLLIADDSQDNEVLVKGLKLYGYDTITASQSHDCLKAVTRTLPEMVVIDMETSCLNCWQTIRALKTSRSTWSIPTIALYDQSIEGKLLLQAGFDSYFRKPVSLKYLLTRIDTLVDSNPINNEGTVGSYRSLTTASLSSETSCAVKSSSMVVYVEDNVKDSRAMADIVTRAGYSYANISDSLQALPQLLDCKPQIIFLDLVMPMANGYELCAQIRRISAFSQTPIVIVTNNDGIVDRVRASIVGASDFVSKPIDEQRILKMVRKYLNPFQSIPKSTDSVQARILKHLGLLR